MNRRFTFDWRGSLICLVLIRLPAVLLAGNQEPSRIVSRTLHGEILTLSSEEAGMVDPALIWRVPLHFSHPMTVTTAHDLAQVKAAVARRQEPQYTAWLALEKAAAAALHFKPQPPVRMYIQGGYEEASNLSRMRGILWDSSSRAYACALMWALSGETKHASKAVEILMAWAHADTVFEGKDRGLQLGSHFTPMLYAVDLLAGCAEWRTAERQAFESFWRRRVLPHTQFVMLHENNWGDNALMSVMAAGIAFEDEALVRRCLSRLNDYFFGDWKVRRDDRGVYLIAEVERNQGRSGLTYTAYAMQAITQLLEMARNFGPEFDWWRRLTTSGGSMQSLVEWYFRWNMLKEPFPWYVDNFKQGAPDQAKGRCNILEVAHTRLPDLDPRIHTWLELHRPVDGAQGDPYTTLLKGVP